MRETPPPAATTAAAVRHALSTSGKGIRKSDDVLGDRVQADRDLRDHGERALGADEQPRQVVARRGLRGAASGADHLPAREHGLEREHVRPHLPVAHGRRSRGVGRGHPPERRVRARVDREEEAVLPCGALQRQPRDAGLHGRRQVCRRDLDDPVEPRQVEADPASNGDHVTLEARARPERRHRDPARPGDHQHLRHVGRRRSGRPRGRVVAACGS